MATRTLEQMAAGGIHDQVGGGFHRYSTDARWRVPHFEKMLYDNALLAWPTSRATRRAARADFAERRARDPALRRARHDVARGRLLLRDRRRQRRARRRARGGPVLHLDARRDPGGARRRTRAAVAAAYYGVTPAGNFEGRSMLHAPRPLDGRGARAGHGARRRSRGDARRCARDRLLAARAQRAAAAPRREDPGRLERPDDLRLRARRLRARRAALRRAGRRAPPSFVLRGCASDGRLLRSYGEGRARHAAYLDDYAFLIAGLLDLYEATGGRAGSTRRSQLDRVLERPLRGPRRRRLLHDQRRPRAAARPREAGYDGAEPSGNSVHALNLLRLHELTGDDALPPRAERDAARRFRSASRRRPRRSRELLLAVDFHLRHARSRS